MSTQARQMSDSCCSAMDDAVHSAGEPGIAVLIRKLGNEVGCVLQASAVPPDQIDAYASALKATDLPGTLRLESWTGLICCPWCGAKIAKTLKNVADLDALVALHERLLAE